MFNIFKHAFKTHCQIVQQLPEIFTTLKKKLRYVFSDKWRARKKDCLEN